MAKKSKTKGTKAKTKGTGKMPTYCGNSPYVGKPSLPKKNLRSIIVALMTGDAKMGQAKIAAAFGSHQGFVSRLNCGKGVVTLADIHIWQLFDLCQKHAKDVYNASWAQQWREKHPRKAAEAEYQGLVAAHAAKTGSKSKSQNATPAATPSGGAFPSLTGTASIEIEDTRTTRTKKKCNRCGEVKALSLYHKDSNAKDKHKGTCKACHALYYQREAKPRRDAKKKSKGKTNKKPFSVPSGGPSRDFTPRRIAGEGTFPVPAVTLERGSEEVEAVVAQATNDAILFTAIRHVPDFAANVLTRLVVEDEVIKEYVRGLMSVDQSAL